MNWQSWIGRVALACAALTAACNGDNNNNNNGGTADGSTSCTPGLKECVTSDVARICQSDGHWAAFKCISGHCADGACVEDTPEEPEEQICLPGEGACSTGNMALICNDTGTAYTATACPSGTNCVGPGLCQGTCVVGEGFCYDLTHRAVCNDGKQFTNTVCTGSDLCVVSNNGVIDTAVCKAAECTPSANGCDAVCGDKKNPSNDPTKSVSRCIETPAGYKWEVLPCPAPYTCSPGVSECGTVANPGTEAACSVDCIEGAKRCGSATAIETCTNGVWGTGVECNDPTSGAATKVCVANGGDPLDAVCGDPQCVNGVGACTSDGKFLPCKTNGTLDREPVTCASGVCVADSAPTAGTTEAAGRCLTLCTEGEERCIDIFGPSSSGQRCKNGKWEELVNCTDEDTVCRSGIVDGKVKIGCYEDCFPGTSFCDSSSDTDIVTCDPDGTFPDDVTTCTIGLCAQHGDTATCDAQCKPGDVDCSADEDDLVSGEDMFPRISTATITCGANGLWGDPVQCADALTCRYDISGRALGCVQCAGQNEVGQPDTQCVDSTDSVQTCTATNTWGPTLACAADTSCTPHKELDFKPIYTPYCTDTIFGPLTEDLLVVFTGGGCAANGFGNPGFCATIDGGSVSNCCADACSPDVITPTPAACVADSN